MSHLSPSQSWDAAILRKIEQKSREFLLSQKLNR